MKHLPSMIYKISISFIGLTFFVCAVAQAATDENTSSKAQTAVSSDFGTMSGTGPVVAAPQPPALVPSPPEINAKSYILMDAETGVVIAEHNADQRRPPASLTKLMTLYLTASALKGGQIKLDDQVLVSKKAWQMGGSKMFIRVGRSVSVSQLIEGVVVASGNDATVALAEYIGGNEKSFVNLMNQTAQSLGMKNTHYVDSTGLPSGKHYSTARDITTLAHAFIENFPEYYPWFKQKWIKYNGIRQPNRNRLLWRDPSIDGIKTGHTQAAGFCLLASGLRNGTRLISLVMGAPTDNARNTDNEALLNYGFRFFETHLVYKAGDPLVTPRVWSGQEKTVPLGISQPLYVTIPTGRYKDLKATVKLNSALQAPIVKGKVYGHIGIRLGEKTVAQVPLVALQDDPKGGLFRRMGDGIGQTMHRWFGGDRDNDSNSNDG